MESILLIFLLIMGPACCLAGALVLALFGWLDYRTLKTKKPKMR